MYDKLPMFLSQVNIFRGRGLSDSHQLAVFLQLYGSEQWVRRTGKAKCNLQATDVEITTFPHHLEC